jgi:pre-mRNA-splicing factor SYF1
MNQSFRVYERGIESFGYPIAFDIWNIYLDKFMARYKGSKLERARDLFEQSLDKVPAKFAKSILLRYAKMEEDFGLARRAMDIYDRSIDIVAPEDKLKIFEIYLAKATSFFGLASTRDIYSKAIQALPNKECRLMCLSFAAVEIKLGEIDRARVIYTHCSQLCDPSSDSEFWKTWSEFEVKFGNEDTFKEMLRLKRSVQAKFNADIHVLSTNLLAQKAAAVAGSLGGVAEASSEPKTMADLEALALADQAARKSLGGTAVTGFVRAKETEPVHKPIQQEDSEMGTAAANPDEIVIDEDDSSDDDEESEEESESEQDPSTAAKNLKLKDVQKVSVPDAVFGSLKKTVVEEEEEDETRAMGAKERLLLSKRKR